MLKNMDKCKNKDILMVQINVGTNFFFFTTNLQIFPLQVHYN